MDEIIENKIKKLVHKYKNYAINNGFKLNPDKKIVRGVIKGLFINEKKFGEKYCPCRRRTGIKEVDKKIICPCVYHKKEIKEKGHCHCFLFVR